MAISEDRRKSPGAAVPSEPSTVSGQAVISRGSNFLVFEKCSEHGQQLYTTNTSVMFSYRFDVGTQVSGRVVIPRIRYEVRPVPVRPSVPALRLSVAWHC